MQKFLVLTIAVLIALGLVFLSSPALAVPDFPVGPPVDVGGQVPVVAAWTLTPLGNYAGFFTAIDAAKLDSGYILIPNLVQISEFRCNTKFKITAKKAATWTLPDEYPALGNKVDGLDSDVLLMVVNPVAGYAPADEGLAAIVPYGATWTAIETDGVGISDIITGGDNTAPGIHGVRDAACDINAKILMDWANDIPGIYAIRITLTIAQP